MQSLCYTEGVGCTLAPDGISFHIKEVLCSAMVLFRSLKLLFLVHVFVCLFVFLCNSRYLGHNSTWAELQFQRGDWRAEVKRGLDQKEKNREKGLQGCSPASSLPVEHKMKSRARFSSKFHSWSHVDMSSEGHSRSNQLCGPLLSHLFKWLRLLHGHPFNELETDILAYAWIIRLALWILSKIKDLRTGKKVQPCTCADF